MKLIFTLMSLLAIMLASQNCSGPAQRPARVTMVEGGGYGQAIFIVEPSVGSDECSIAVERGEPKGRLGCNSEYLIACDISIPDRKPFCRPVSEIGVQLESTYPKELR